MTRTLLLAAIALAAISAAPCAPAASASRHHVARRYPRPRGPAVVRPYPQQRIACTVLGCNPVPAGCGSTYGRTLGGTPTGYDVVVCPPGIQPFR